MTIRFWHWDKYDTIVISDQGDFLAIKEFISYVNGLEREKAAEQAITPDAAIVCPNGCPDVDTCWACGSALQIVPAGEFLPLGRWRYK